jgi:tRNA-5-methyluridine54 2-sulfurtransferase
MKCSKCSSDAVFSSPAYCKAHFIEYFEEKVQKTIVRFSLFSKKEKIAVAVSGGKDSMSLLNALHSLGYDVTAIAVDEGILGYRDSTLKTLKMFCKKNKIPVKIFTFKSLTGKTLDSLLKDKKHNPCTLCGILRRYLLNLGSRGFDAIATGHNLDDESQAILMNLLRNNMPLLARCGPISGVIPSKKFTKRAKPLYMITEKESLAYAYLNGLVTKFKECPYVFASYRLKIRDMLNAIEAKKPKTKEKIVLWYLSYKKKQPSIKEDIGFCSICSEPSANAICNACLILEEIRK